MNLYFRNGFLLRPRAEVRGRAYAVIVNTLFSRTFATSQNEKPPRPPKKFHRTNIISEELCDDIVQRTSHLLVKNKPSVILDLNPGYGYLSSKINSLIQPDRHVLIEPRVHYKRYIKSLSAREGVELYDEKMHYEAHKGIGWMSLLNKYMANSTPKEGERNDLLIIANLTDILLKNASRIWAALIGHSLLGSGHFRDWTIRTILILPPDEADSIVPRSVGNRKKVAFLNEAYSRQSFIIAETDNVEYIMPRGLEIVEQSAAKVAERTAENNIKIPEGRKRPDLESFTEVPAGWRTETYTMSTPLHAGAVFKNYTEKKKLYDDASEGNNADEKRERRLDLTRARASLVHDAKTISASIDLAKDQLEIDRLEETVVNAKLDSNTDAEVLNAQNTILADRRGRLAVKISENGTRVSRAISNWTNNYRVALGTSGDINDSLLIWDHRPFEPLYIRQEEVSPKGKGLSVMYIEPEPRDVLVKKFAIDTAHDRQDEAVEIALSVMGAFGIRGNESVADMVDKLFPGRPFMEILNLVPELFPHIPKQLQPSSSSQSSSNSTNPSENTSATSMDAASDTLFSSPSPNNNGITTTKAMNESNDLAKLVASTTTHAEFSYFPTQINLRCLPTPVLLQLLRLYLKTSDTKSFLQVNRSLGGSATMYSLRSWVGDRKSER